MCYFGQFSIIFHDLGVVDTLFYYLYKGTKRIEARISLFKRYLILNIPSRGYFISQSIPHGFLSSWGHLHSILLCILGAVLMRGLHCLVHMIFHVQHARRAYHISTNSPLFPMILVLFTLYFTVV